MKINILIFILIVCIQLSCSSKLEQIVDMKTEWQSFDGAIHIHFKTKFKGFITKKRKSEIDLLNIPIGIHSVELQDSIIIVGESSYLLKKYRQNGDIILKLYDSLQSHLTLYLTASDSTSLAVSKHGKRMQIGEYFMAEKVNLKNCKEVDLVHSNSFYVQYDKRKSYRCNSLKSTKIIKVSKDMILLSIYSISDFDSLYRVSSLLSKQLDKSIPAYQILKNQLDTGLYLDNLSNDRYKVLLYKLDENDQQFGFSEHKYVIGVEDFEAMRISELQYLQDSLSTSQLNPTGG